jgi:hypothetical protein
MVAEALSLTMYEYTINGLWIVLRDITVRRMAQGVRKNRVLSMSTPASGSAWGHRVSMLGRKAGFEGFQELS